MVIAFCAYYTGNPWQPKVHEDSLLFSSVNFIILPCTFRVLIHFELI